MHYLQHNLCIIALISLLTFLQSCKNSNDEPDMPIRENQAIVFFSDGVRFHGGFEDYKCKEPYYIIKPDCFEVIGDKWYALEYNAYYSGGTNVNLLVNGQKQATILSNCYSVQQAVAYKQNGRFKAYIFYFDADQKYHGIHYDNGKIEEIGGLKDFERILLVRTVNNDVYAVWNMDVNNFYEVGNIVITKNGNPVKQNLKLPSNSSVRYFRDLCVEGTTIYTFFTLHRDKNQAYYAKDNKLVIMNGLDDVCYGQVVDGKVYGLGVTQNNGQKCCYWEDGKVTTIIPESAPVSPRGLVVENGSIYYLVTNYAVDASILFRNGEECIRQDGELSGFKFIY